MGKYSFTVLWSKEDQAYVATSPEFAGVSALGPTADGALREARDALALALRTYEDEGWEPPEPRLLPEYSGQFRLRIPKSLHAKLAELAELECVSLNSLAMSLLAQGLGMKRGGAEHPKYPTKISQSNTRKRTGTG